MPPNDGRGIAQGRDMSARKTLDRQPGAAPEIRSLGDQVTFQLDIAGLPDRIKLLIRCDESGEVLASLATGFESPNRLR